MSNQKFWATAENDSCVVQKNAAISRGVATYRAYHKLGVLNKEISEYAAASEFDKAYEKLASVFDGSTDMFIPIPLTDSFSIFNLYYAFRDAYSAFEEVHPVWKKYNLEDFKIFDGGYDIQAHAMLRGNNDVDGLYFMSKVVEKQAEESKKLMENFTAEHKGLQIRFMDPAAYIALTAIRIELGEKPVDFVSYTRFINIPPKEVDDKLFVPLARWSGDAMRFGWSSILSLFGDCGTRFTVSQL